VTIYQTIWKPVVDRVFGLLAIVALSPLLLISALLIRLEDGGPALFRQQRVGKDGQNFQIFKFRSMPTGTRTRTSADGGGLALTRVGRIIRRLNIDELPQLFNVARGEMSLIGPRAGLPSQTELHNLRRENGAIALKPGISGLAQVEAYDGMSEAKKAMWDGQYASKLSFAGDIRIVLRTVLYLFKPPPTY
jgi:O-antigen biosynthesis protein WbqP